MAELTLENKASLREMARIPTVAWPTFLMFIGALAIWSGGLAANAAGLLPAWLAVVTGFLSTYLLYMVMHEAAHGSISRHRWANTLVGSIAAIPFGGAYWLYRFAHLKHHSHTNHEKEDPDYYSGGAPLIIHWFTQDFYYLEKYRNDPRRFTLLQRTQNLMQPAIVFGFMGWLIYLGYWQAVLFAWFLPWRLAIGWLAFAFNYLPHAPHEVEQRANRFAATVCRRPRALKWILLFQNYHNIHHLYPSAPFYRMEKMWDVDPDYFEDNGTRVV